MDSEMVCITSGSTNTTPAEVAIAAAVLRQMSPNPKDMRARRDMNNPVKNTARSAARRPQVGRGGSATGENPLAEEERGEADSSQNTTMAAAVTAILAASNMGTSGGGGQRGADGAARVLGGDEQRAEHATGQAGDDHARQRLLGGIEPEEDAVLDGAGDQSRHHQSDDDGHAQRDRRRRHGEDLDRFGLDYLPEAVMRERDGADGLGHVDHSLRPAPAALVMAEGRYSTSSWVSSMKASSSDAVIGMSSYTRKPGTRRQVTDLGGGEPLDSECVIVALTDPSTLGRECRREGGHIGRDKPDDCGAASADEVGHAGLGDQPPPTDHHQPIGSQ